MQLHADPALRLHAVPRRPSAALVDALGAIPTPNLSDSLGKLAASPAALRPMHRRGRLAGPAFTVRVPAGDNLLAYKGIAAAQPGDVLVIDAGGVLEQAIVGEIMTTWAARRGLAGMVVWGAVRDVDVIAQNDFPVFACGATCRGPYRDGPGTLNATLALGGMVVVPGDLVVGDANGVVCIPQDDLEPVARKAREIQLREEALVAQIRSGGFDPDWLDAALRQRGYAL